MENLKPRHFKWIFVLQAFVVCAHYALAQCRFACHTPDETNKRNTTRLAKKIMEKLDPRRFEWISVLQAFVACPHYALGQCRFSCYAPDERSQYFQCPSCALLGQAVLQRRFSRIGAAGRRRR